MQKSSALQPLTLNNVTKHDEIWSSDSDSGITVGSHSPPSKITPDSGIGSEQLSWNLPPPPPSLLADDPYLPAMEPRDASGPVKRPVLSPEEPERQREQEYVRKTLLVYEQEKLRKERDGLIYATDGNSNQYASDGNSNQYIDSNRSDTKDVDFNSNSRLVNHGDRVATHHTKNSSEDRFESLASQYRRGATNNYTPASQISQNAPQSHDREQRFPRASDGNTGTEAFSESYRPQNQHGRDVVMPDPLIADDMFASAAGDEGYGTDNRSHTTASIASPLSSSLSSLTTDSSSSLNGSQRGAGGSNGMGSTRAQPVPSSGRLVMARRGILVKRRDLPPVERIESETLEDKLRALTTIEEEDPGAPAATNSGPLLTSSSAGSASHSGVSGSGRRPAGGSAVYEDTSKDYDGLYTVINKNRHPLPVSGDPRQRQHRHDSRERSSGRPSPASGFRERGDRHSPLSPPGRQQSSGADGFHRAVPVRLDADGNTFFPSGPSDPRSGSGGGDDGSVSGGLGLGGVKVNDSGEIEIDYSYYMKATPSESNDEVNTYSPTHPPQSLTNTYASGRLPQPGQSGFRQDVRADVHSPRDFTSRHPRTGSRDGRSDPSGGPPRPRVQDVEFSVESDQLFMRMQPREASLRQGGVMCSMPNLSMHGPSVSRRRSAEGNPQDLSRNTAYEAPRQPHENYPGQVHRRNPPPGSGYPATRRAGQGERNSCDVGSLYRQADFNVDSVHLDGGVAADRMSLNLGDLPRIQEQLRATSEMLLSSGPKRHQFASSSDIYRLFQGQRGGPAAGFPQGRNVPNRHSFHTYPSLNPAQNLSDVKSRLRPNAVVPPGRSDQSQASSVQGMSGQGPVKGNHNISVPEHVARSSVGRCRDGELGVNQNMPPSRRRSLNSISSLDSDSSHLTESLPKGQQFVTDIVLDENGERLSTLV